MKSAYHLVGAFLMYFCSCFADGSPNLFCGTACCTQTALRAFSPPAIPPERDIKKTGTRKKDRTDGGLRDAQAEEGFFCGFGEEHIGLLEKPDAMYKYFLISNGPAASVIGDPCVQ